MKTKKKILIVGGTGFIGYWLARHCLKKNFQVFSISMNKPRRERYIKKVKYIIVDIRKKLDLMKKVPKDIDYVINLGGHVNHQEKMITYQSHFNGCKNLVEILKKKKIKLFIQMGSSVENVNLKSPQSEKISNKKPKFGYNLAKYSATNYLLDEFRFRKFPVIIFRLYQVYGPHQDTNRLIPFVINECLEKKDFPCSHGKQYRDFIYINDLIILISRCLKSNFIGEIFNVGSGKPIKVKNVINKIRNKIKNGNPNFGKLALRKDETRLVYPNINKAKKYFNWKPKMSFDKGLNKTIKFFKKIKRKKQFRITAVIPVRKNSKRVKNKNFKRFHKKNLLVYKIEQLKRLKEIKKIVINTDSEKAIRIAKRHNVAYWRRESYFASSKCKNSDFWKHIAETTEGDYILFINCTSPLIKDSTIKNVIKIFKKKLTKFDSINTATSVKEFLYKNNRPFNFNPSKAPNSQNLPNLNKLNFGVNLISRENMIKNKSIIGKKPYLLKVTEIEGIDIDTNLDFKFAEYIFKNSKR